MSNAMVPPKFAVLFTIKLVLRKLITLVSNESTVNEFNVLRIYTSSTPIIISLFIFQ